ncbi:MAG: TolC family protein [Planctomycetes bacterium]|nr:TolC family protein [Planctomycetota bacterium]
MRNVAWVTPASFDVSPSPQSQLERLPPVTRYHNRDGSMTLAHAVGMALQNSDIVRVSEGDSVVSDPSTAFDVGAADARVLAALAEFDVSWESEFYTTSSKQPPNAFFGPGLTPLPTERDEAALSLGINKRWGTGAQTSVSFNPDPTYLFVPQTTSGRFNPSYVGELELSVRQPLLRSAGARVNRAPIQISRIEFEQSAWEFKKAVMASMRSVVAAYWELQAADVAISSIDEVIPLLEEVVRIQEENFKTEWVIYADVAKAHTQLHEFRQRRLELQSLRLESELRLRNLIGLLPTDGWRIVPTDDPNAAPTRVDTDESVAIAMSYQPDLVRQRLDTRIRELELLVAKNGLQPNLDFQALYRMNGVGDRLDNALRQMYSAEYSDWLVGFTFSVPLGNREATANARAAELQFARANGLLHQEALSVAHQVSNDIREIEFAFQEYKQAYQRLQATGDWLSGSRLRYQNPRPGSEPNWLVQSLNDYLAALRSRTSAATEAATVLARYNTAIVELEESKGTLLEYLNVDLAADPCRQSQWLPTPTPAPRVPKPITAPKHAPSASVATGSPYDISATIPPRQPQQRMSIAPQMQQIAIPRIVTPLTTARTPSIVAPSSLRPASGPSRSRLASPSLLGP